MFSARIPKVGTMQTPQPSVLIPCRCRALSLAFLLCVQWMLGVAKGDFLLLNAIEDSRIISLPAVPSFADSNFGLESMLSVYSLPGNTQRSLLKFNVASVPANQQIDSAILTLYRNTTFGDNGNPSNLPMTAHQVMTSWSESTVTWNSPWTTAGGDFGASVFGTASANPASNQPVNWDVTGLVQSWYSGSTPNHGLLLQSTTGNELSFWSDETANANLRPSLSVNFTAVPEPSSLMLIGALAGAVCFRRMRRN